MKKSVKIGVIIGLAILLIAGIVSLVLVYNSIQKDKKNAIKHKDKKVEEVVEEETEEEPELSTIDIINMLEDYKYTDTVYSLLVDDEEYVVSVSIRENGFSASFVGDNPYDVDGEFIVYADNTLYLNVPQSLAEIINVMIDDNKNAVFELEPLKLSAGWTEVIRLPEEIKLEEHVFELVDGAAKMCIAIANLCENDDEKINIDIEKHGDEIAVICTNYISETVKTVISELETEATSINYMSYIGELMDENDSFLDMIMPTVFVVKLDYSKLLKAVKIAMNISSDDEINQIIYSYIPPAIEDFTRMAEEYEDDIPEYIHLLDGRETTVFAELIPQEDMDPLIKVTVEDNDFVLTVEVMENEELIQKPAVTNGCSAYGLILAGALIIPNYVSF